MCVKSVIIDVIGKIAPVNDAFTPHTANMSRGTYLFPRSFNRLAVDRTNANHISRTGRGGLSARALRTDSRRNGCQRASKLWPLLALSFWLQHVETVMTTTMSLWLIQSQKSQHTQANSDIKLAVRALGPARRFNYLRQFIFLNVRLSRLINTLTLKSSERLWS